MASALHKESNTVVIISVCHRSTMYLFLNWHAESNILGIIYVKSKSMYILLLDVMYKHWIGRCLLYGV